VAERLRRCVVAAAVATALGWAAPAQADRIIDRPLQQPEYSVEIEPHALLGPLPPPGDSGGLGFGAGLRLSIPVLRDGFIRPINDSVAIGFGLDWVHYDGEQAAVGRCAQFVPGPNGTQICIEVTSDSGPADYYYAPVVMQWNFWLFDAFSSFAEVGLAPYYQSQEYEDGDLGITGLFQLGGRLHFAPWAALSFRIGYPTLSLGLSFLL
jgi:hypothetical protein